MSKGDSLWRQHGLRLWFFSPFQFLQTLRAQKFPYESVRITKPNMLWRTCRYILQTLFMVDLLRKTDCTRIKIIEEPFSIHHGGINSQNAATSEKEIALSVQPKKLSGPPHFFELKGKCFELIKNSYKYEFCPFNKATQREQTYRWNAFHGALGVWREWKIAGNTYSYMLMTNGEYCNRDLKREVMVFFSCGDKNRFVDIAEPLTCKYNLTFETPLACPLDAFLVYPTLSKDGKLRWESIEERYREGELTERGYAKRRRELFIEEGLNIDEERETQEKSSEQKRVDESVARENGSADYRLFGRVECIQKYGELLIEVERLRLMLRMSKEAEKKGIMKEAENEEESKKMEEGRRENRNSTGEISVIGDELKNGKHGDDLIEQSPAKTEQNAKEQKLVTNMGSRHPRNVKKGQKGDDGTVVKAKLHENSVIQNIGSLLRNTETSRKKVNLTNEEQEKRDQELVEKHSKTHRVH